MEEDQAEYFVILIQDRYRAQTISNLSRTERFMVESSYKDDPTIDRKFVVIAGQESHVLQEAKRYWDNGVLLVCVQCVKTNNSKHLLRALKKIYESSGNSKSSGITFSGQEMILRKGISFNNVRSAARVLGQNLNHHYRAFQEFCESVSIIVGTHQVNVESERRCRELEEENEKLWNRIEELEGSKDGEGKSRRRNSEKKFNFWSLLLKMMVIVFIFWIMFFHESFALLKRNLN